MGAEGDGGPGIEGERDVQLENEVRLVQQVNVTANCLCIFELSSVVHLLGASYRSLKLPSPGFCAEVEEIGSLRRHSQDPRSDHGHSHWQGTLGAVEGKDTEIFGLFGTWVVSPRQSE